MAANVLNSPQAVAMSDIYHRLQPLLQPPPDPPRKKIGFHAALA